MKKVMAVLVSSLLAVSVFAQSAPATTPATQAPAKVEKKGDVKPSKSDKKADAKATTQVPATK